MADVKIPFMKSEDSLRTGNDASSPVTEGVMHEFPSTFAASAASTQETRCDDGVSPIDLNDSKSDAESIGCMTSGFSEVLSKSSQRMGCAVDYESTLDEVKKVLDSIPMQRSVIDGYGGVVDPSTVYRLAWTVFTHLHCTVAAGGEEDDENEEERKDLVYAWPHNQSFAQWRAKYIGEVGTNSDGSYSLRSVQELVALYDDWYSSRITEGLGSSDDDGPADSCLPFSYGGADISSATFPATEFSIHPYDLVDDEES